MDLILVCLFLLACAVFGVTFAIVKLARAFHREYQFKLALIQRDAPTIYTRVR